MTNNEYQDVKRNSLKGTHPTETICTKQFHIYSSFIDFIVLTICFRTFTLSYSSKTVIIDKWMKKFFFNY